MKQNHNSILGRYILVSGTLLTFMTIASSPPLLTMACTMLPLVLYHLAYLRPRAKEGLSQAAIDSVYYFGFLITIGALAASAIKLSTSAQQAENLTEIGFQFGLGLLATGYAVFARMHLGGAGTHSSLGSTESAMGKIVENSWMLATNIQLASERFEEYANARTQALQQLEDAGRSRIETTITQATNAFHEAINETSRAALSNLKDVHELLANNTLRIEQARFTRALSATTKGLENAALQTEELVRTTARLTTASGFAVPTIEDFTAKLNACTQSIARLGSDNGTIDEAVNRLQDAALEIAACTEALRPAVGELRQISQITEELQPGFKGLKSTAKKAAEQLEALKNTTDTFVTIAERFRTTVEATAQFSNHLTALSTTLPALRQETDHLARSFQGIGIFSGSLTSTLTDLSAQAIQLKEGTGEAHEVVRTLLHTIRDVITQAQQASNQLVENQPAVQNIQALLADTQALHRAIATTGETVIDFGTTVQALQAVVASATTTIKTSVTETTAALAYDLKQSTEATRMLTGSFITIAENIIEHTKVDDLRA